MDNSIGGLVFSVIFLLIAFAIWYWAIFKNGAKAWSNTSLSYQKKIWRLLTVKDIEKRFRYVFHPTIFKVATSAIFLIAIYVVYMAIRSV